MPAVDSPRNANVNANDFFSNRNNVPKALYRYNTLGATIGGPLYIPKLARSLKDKLFFFYSFENWASYTPRPLSQITVPTALERQGNFSQTLDLNGQVIPIKDPLTGAPFPGNVIPDNRLNKDGQALISVFPQPNVLNRSITQGNYNYNFLTSFKVPKHNHLGKMDYQPTAKDHIWVRSSNWCTARSSALSPSISRNPYGYMSDVVSPFTIHNTFLSAMKA